jgi:hypothetical protein
MSATQCVADPWEGQALTQDPPLRRRFLWQTHRARWILRARKTLEWFREASYFGLFIHWGLYALPPVNGRQRTLGLGEWLMLRAPVPVRDYEKLASQFNPVT